MQPDAGWIKGRGDISRWQNTRSPLAPLLSLMQRSLVVTSVGGAPVQSAVRDLVEVLARGAPAMSWPRNRAAAPHTLLAQPDVSSAALRLRFLGLAVSRRSRELLVAFDHPAHYEILVGSGYAGARRAWARDLLESGGTLDLSRRVFEVEDGEEKMATVRLPLARVGFCLQRGS